MEAEREANSSKWKQKVVAQPTYKTPEQLTKELNERLRQEKEARLASLQQHHGSHSMR